MNLNICSKIIISFLFVSFSLFLNTFAQSQSDEVEGIYCPQINKLLRLGYRDTNTGGQVSELQQFLVDYYNLEPSQLLTTGIFGRITKGYVMNFQRDNDLIITGIVGVISRAKINTVCTERDNISATTTNPAAASTPNPLQCPAVSVPTCTGGTVNTVSYAGCNFYSCNYVATTTQTINQCTPFSDEFRTLTCPTGQTGSITQKRISTCTFGATTPGWNNWTEILNTCNVATQTNTNIKNLTWTKTSRQVLDIGPAGKWDQHSTYNPRIAKLSDGITPYKDQSGYYYMYYTASAGEDNTDYDATGLAKSTDLINWTRISVDSPILSRTLGGLDAGDNSAVTVIYDNGKFHMWHEGNSTSPGLQTGDNVTVNYATSVNGETWNRNYNNPVINKGTGGDKDDVYAPIVIKDGSVWKMWYTGHSTGNSDSFGIMYATASNPEGPWTRHSTNYIVQENYGIFPASVWKDGNVYNMLYSGNPMPIYTTSADGINWSNKIEFMARGNTIWDAGLISWPSIMKENGVYTIFYHGDAYNKGVGYMTTAATAPSPAPKLTIHKPLTTYPVQIGRSITVSGVCDSSRGAVVISVSSDSQTINCNNDTFSGTIQYTGTATSVTISVKYVNGQIEHSYNLNIILSLTPFTINSHVGGSTITNRVIAVTGTCDSSQGTIIIALGYDTTNTTCNNGAFSATINYTGGNGNVSMAGKYITSSEYLVNLSVLINIGSTVTTEVPLTLTAPTTGQILNSRSINLNGTCDASKGNVFAAVWNNTAVIPCINNTYTGTVNFTGNAGNHSVGIKYTSSSNYLINLGVFINI